MQAFAYHTPTTVAAAAGAAGGDAKYIAGGQSLLGSMKLGLAAPSVLIDLAGTAELKGITVAQGTVTIGAMTTHATVAASAEVRAAIPALADLAGQIGDRQVRSRGTMGGSLANNDPSACYPAAALASGATIVTNRRKLAAADFFKAALVTSGTATLETALFEVPEVVCYKGSWLSYQKGKRLVKVKYISLVNLIMDRLVVKELIQDNLTVENLKAELNDLLFNQKRIEQVKNDYQLLKKNLHKAGNASEEAAVSILDSYQVSNFIARITRQRIKTKRLTRLMPCI